MLLDSAVQDSPCVGSVGGTEVKSSVSIESGLKKKQLCKVKVKTASPQERCTSPASHIMIQKAIIFFQIASSYFGTDGGNWE